MNGTSDVTVNATLQPAPPTFRLTGSITGSAAFFLAVTAQSTTGTSSFSGSIDPVTNKYLVMVPADTYRVSVSYLASLTAGPNISTFLDPAPVQVTGDTVRDITVIPTVQHAVSGTISPFDPRFPKRFLIFGPKDLNTASSTIFTSQASLKADGTYAGQLSDGTFSVLLGLSTADASRNSLLVLGSVTVNGADVTADFTVPALSTLSGTVSMADMSPVPKGSTVIGVEGNLLLVRNTTGFPLLSFGSGTIGDASGSYQIVLVSGHTYTLGVDLPLFAEALPQTAGDFTMLLPSTAQLGDDSTQDITVPQLPGTVAISGQITDTTGAPVANVTVDANTAEVSGVPLGGFSRSTTTDPSGNYRLVVLSGANYDMNFTPPAGMGASPFSVNTRWIRGIPLRVNTASE